MAKAGISSSATGSCVPGVISPDCDLLFEDQKEYYAPKEYKSRRMPNTGYNLDGVRE